MSNSIYMHTYITKSHIKINSDGKKSYLVCWVRDNVQTFMCYVYLIFITLDLRISS